ncbi:MAG TPA: methyltransferase domain-containing protein [Candidatus Desulfobacillus sp.]|nr:methyltransferase domain-containing protein [Candidatus Desulfobacillus sp.]
MTALKALAAQLLAWLLVAGGCLAFGLPLRPSVPLAALQGAVAAALGRLLGQPRWWLAIHLAFSPALVAALRLELPPAAPLAVLALLVVVFWTTFRGEVPLFLSSRGVADAVLGLLPPRAGLRVVDLGCGSGGLLLRLARARPDARFLGIEHAPLPWLLARWRGRGLANLELRRGDLWRAPLAEADVVFVFLSPSVMPRLWRRAHEEMRPGSLLVSSSFPAPGAAPERVVEADGRRRTALYCYRL